MQVSWSRSIIPPNEDVYPNEYFASNPPYPEFKVVTSRNARPPAGAWDDKGNNLLPDLLAHKYVGNFDLLPFKGFTKPHSSDSGFGRALSRRAAEAADAWRDRVLHRDRNVCGVASRD